MRDLFVVQPAIANSGRLPVIGNMEQPIQKLEVAFLFLMGIAAAAAATFLELKLKIPGHAIIRVVLPLAFGIALVPRRDVGLSMGLVAAVSALAFNGTHLGSTGVGAMTSLLFCGVVLDFVASRTRSGWRLYVGLALAGLTVNMAAFAAKLGSKLAGVGGGGPLDSWLPRAAVSYPLCGLAAGLICAIILFRTRPNGDRQ